MKDRIKQIRKSHDLTQEEFAKRLGTPRSNIANYEKGNRNPSDGIITYMCKEFGISEEWLRYGKGRMEADVSRENEIAALMRSSLHGSEEFKEAVIQAIRARSQSELEVMEKMFWDVVYNLQKNKKGQDES